MSTIEKIKLYKSYRDKIYKLYWFLFLLWLLIAFYYHGHEWIMTLISGIYTSIYLFIERYLYKRIKTMYEDEVHRISEELNKPYNTFKRNSNYNT